MEEEKEGKSICTCMKSLPLGQMRCSLFYFICCHFINVPPNFQQDAPYVILKEIRNT